MKEAIRGKKLFNQDKLDKIDFQKLYNQLNTITNKKTKVKKCYFCKQEKPIIDSHSLPAFILDNLSNNGNIYFGPHLINLDLKNFEKGIQNAGIFRLLCKECDNEWFKYYEDERVLKNLSVFEGDYLNKILASMALKNYLYRKNNKLHENEHYVTILDHFKVPFNFDTLISHNNIDITDLDKNINSCMNQILDQELAGFKLVYENTLSYKVGISTQTIIALPNDLNGKMINDIDNPNAEINYIHFSIFTLSEITKILIYCTNKSFAIYKSFFIQFFNLSSDQKLRLLLSIIFKYTDEFYFNPNFYDKYIRNDTCVKSKFTETFNNPLYIRPSDLSKNDYKDIINYLDTGYSID